MKNVILFRSNRDLEEELEVCKKHFDTSSSRVGLKDALVIGRYSVLPFYKELEQDLKIQGSTLINSYMDHDFIASFDWYYQLEDLTPKTYFLLEHVPKNKGPFVVKGKTNSRKHQWSTKMFAKDFAEAVRIHYELLNDDALISQQGTVIREYVELENFGYGINGQPFANEWRCFFYKGQLLSYGYYWVNGDFVPEKSAFDKEAMDFVLMAADRIKEDCSFYVIDIARTKAGKWIVIEVNDGQQSGLSGNDPEELYKNLKLSLQK